MTGIAETGRCSRCNDSAVTLHPRGAWVCTACLAPDDPYHANRRALLDKAAIRYCDCVEPDCDLEHPICPHCSSDEWDFSNNDEALCRDCGGTWIVQD